MSLLRVNWLERGTIEGVKVLLVEDDQSIADSVTASLTTAGMVVEHVATGKASIDYFVDDICDVVLMDLGLPDMDGLDEQRRYERHPLYQSSSLVLAEMSWIEFSV